MQVVLLFAYLQVNYSVTNNLNNSYDSMDLV